MGCPLGPVLAIIFMIELENTIIPYLENRTKIWKRYVEDNFFHKSGLNKSHLATLNSFHSNTKFTIEIEKDSAILFFFVIKIQNRIHTKI